MHLHVEKHAKSTIQRLNLHKLIKGRARLNPKLRAFERAPIIILRNEGVWIQIFDKLIEPLIITNVCANQNCFTERTCTECGAFVWMGERLTVSSTSAPNVGLFCLNGKIKLPDLPVPPSLLHS